MIITKAQSKQLRYACGAVDYNQPCTRKYTGTPEGKLREIGRFKYIENGGELKSLTFDGGAVNLDGITFDVLLACVMEGDGLDPIQVAALPEPKKPSDIEDAVALALTAPEPDAVVHLDVVRGNDVHAVNVPVTVDAAAPATDDWMDGEGNDPDNIDQGTADVPELLTEEEKKAAEECNAPPGIGTSTEVPPVELTGHAFAKEDAEKSIEDVEGQPLTGAPTLPFATPDAFKGIAVRVIPVPPAKTPKQMSPEELTEDVIREVSMTAAAREAARLHQIEYMNLPDVPSQNIIRANAKIPGFLDDYGKCLEKVGMARTLTEIAKALPGQINWIFR